MRDRRGSDESRTGSCIIPTEMAVTYLTFLFPITTY